MPRPAPVQQPRISWWGHTWRLAVVGITSLVLFAIQVSELGRTLPDGTWTWDPANDARLWVDLVVGLVTAPLVLFRRRWPVAVALVLSVVSVFSTVAAGPAMLALMSLATRRRWREVAVVLVPTGVATAVYESFFSVTELGMPLLVYVALSLVITALFVAIGYYIGARRELVGSLLARAEAAERAQQAREEQARTGERNRIAREMHDVLAHRISVVTMHAGALASRTDLTPDQVREAARVIEDGSRAAMRDLRSVLGVLRDGDPGVGAAEKEPPQPTLAVLDALVADAREHGPVDLVLPLGGRAHDDPFVAQVPEEVSRAAYRVVQEGLTNVRKHAPGAPTVARVDVTPGEDVLVSVVNIAPASPPPSGTPSGLGLLGIRERAELLGGSARAGARPGGGFALEVRLPWPA